MKRFAVWCFLACLAGCAAMPPEQFLGIKSEERPAREGELSPERIPQTVSMRFPGKIGEVDGYRVDTPLSWRDREFVCRIFRDIEGIETEICRRVSRVFVGDKEYSAFIRDSSWFFFVPKGTQVSLVRFPSADGKSYLPANPSPLKEEDLLEVYKSITKVFPFQSKPIGGVQILFGEETLRALSVPSLITWEERARLCDVFAISSSEIVGISTSNPMAALPKLFALACSVTTGPNHLVKAEDPANVDARESMRGDQQ